MLGWVLALLRQVVQFAKQAGAYKESDTERDGAFSWSGETHGFALGVYYGFKDFRDWDGLPDDYADTDAQVETGHYPKGGYVVGAVLRVLCYVALGGALMTLL